MLSRHTETPFSINFENKKGSPVTLSEIFDKTHILGGCVTMSGVAETLRWIEDPDHRYRPRGDFNMN
jgi:hypothetical protein